MLSFWSLEHVWLKIKWLKSSHNPRVVKSTWRKSHWTERRHENAAWLLSTAATMFEIWALEAESLVSG